MNVTVTSCTPGGSATDVTGPISSLEDLLGYLECVPGSRLVITRLPDEDEHFTRGPEPAALTDR